MRSLSLLWAGAAFYFGCGFVTSLLDLNEAIELALGPLIGVLVIAAIIAFGSRRNLAAALAAGLVLGGLVVPCVLYGSYVAHVSGWNGVDVRDFGSDDIPGQRYIWIASAVGLVPASLAGSLLGLVTGTLARYRT